MSAYRCSYCDAAMTYADGCTRVPHLSWCPRAPHDPPPERRAADGHYQTEHPTHRGETR